MKKLITLFTFVSITFFSCNSDNNTPTETIISVNFTHNWDGVQVTNQDFNDFKFTNANGEQISIERLRYIISNITLTDSNSQKISINNYNLVDVGENLGVTIKSENTIPTGTYKLSFTFGFSDADNQDGVYQDLNTANFNVPGMLGGGYHYMQFEGKYLDTNNAEANFNYHAIRAVNRTDPNNLVFQDTSVKVNLGTVTISNNVIIEIKMNIAEWFKNPYTWNLNQLNTVLMPNFDAQILMNQNGETVFSLGEITQ